MDVWGVDNNNFLSLTLKSIHFSAFWLAEDNCFNSSDVQCRLGGKVGIRTPNLPLLHHQSYVYKCASEFAFDIKWTEKDIENVAKRATICLSAFGLTIHIIMSWIDFAWNFSALSTLGLSNIVKNSSTWSYRVSLWFVSPTTVRSGAVGMIILS